MKSKQPATAFLAKLAPPAKWGLSLALALGALTSWQLLLQTEARPPHRPTGGSLGLVRVAAPTDPGVARNPPQSALPQPAERGDAPPAPPPAAENFPVAEAHPSPAPPAKDPPVTLAATGVPPPASEIPPAAPPVAVTRRPAAAPPGGKGVSATPRRKPSPAAAPLPGPLNGGAPTPVEQEALDRGFRLLHPVRPAFPVQARRAGRGGEVKIEAMVDPRGQVRRVKIVAETAGWGFGEAVRTAYGAARFSPPTQGGRPVWVVWRKTLRFTP